MKAQRIVFDAVDIVLTLLNDPLAQRREIQRLHNWLLARELTALVTCKRNPDGTIQPPLDFMQFMVDCDTVLQHEVAQGISQRNLRVVKYRGSAFDENEAPFAIGRNGLDVARTRLTGPHHGSGHEATGFQRRRAARRRGWAAAIMPLPAC